VLTNYSRTNFRIAPYHSKISETSIKVIGPKTWIDIPTDLKSLPFRKTFSKKLKHLYLSKLPTEKRTKNLDLSKKKDIDLKELFDESDSDFVFIGFESATSP